ncbi:MAG: hypothetical protein IJ328_06725 [Muribaculaceae bacterium]|nr:hypothetical protein [Muribaculaceae bacterium]
MKFNKIFALLLAAAMFTACSDDDADWNSSAVTVSMDETEISVKENNGIFNVPVSVKADNEDGAMNGPVEVTVEVTEVGENTAMENVHYFVTQKTIKIVAEEGTGNIEIRAADDNDINEARTFTVTIVDVKGGTIGENATTTVTIKDNDSVFYEKLQGRWKMSATSLSSGSSETWNVNVIGFNEGEPGYNEVLYITGMLGYEWTMLEVYYHFDMETKTGYLEVPYGTLFAEGVSFSGLGVMDVYTGTVSEDGYIVVRGSFTGEWNDEFNFITFDPEAQIYGFLAPTGSGSLNGYVWFGYAGFTMTR